MAENEEASRWEVDPALMTDLVMILSMTVQRMERIWCCLIRRLEVSSVVDVHAIYKARMDPTWPFSPLLLGSTKYFVLDFAENDGHVWRWDSTPGFFSTSLAKFSWWREISRRLRKLQLNTPNQVRSLANVDKMSGNELVRIDTNILPKAKLIVVFCGLAFALLICFIDQNSIGIALPTIGADLNAATTISWAGTSSLIANTVFQVLYGRLVTIPFL